VDTGNDFTFSLFISLVIFPSRVSADRPAGESITQKTLAFMLGCPADYMGCFEGVKYGCRSRANRAPRCANELDKLFINERLK
jgi:hypothetical protein